MKPMFLAILTGITFVVQGCASNAGHQNQPSYVNSIDELPLGRAGVFVYREDQPLNPAAVNIYIDGDYFASLPTNHYRYTNLCPGRHTWNAIYHNADPAYYAKLNSEHTFDLGEGGVVYMKVTSGRDGEATLVPVSRSEAAGKLGYLYLQDHTLSRIAPARTCQ